MQFLPKKLTFFQKHFYKNLSSFPKKLYASPNPKVKIWFNTLRKWRKIYTPKICLQNCVVSFLIESSKMMLMTNSLNILNISYKHWSWFSNTSCIFIEVGITFSKYWEHHLQLSSINSSFTIKTALWIPKYVVEVRAVYITSRYIDVTLNSLWKEIFSLVQRKTVRRYSWRQWELWKFLNLGNNYEKWCIALMTCYPKIKFYQQKNSQIQF